MDSTSSPEGLAALAICESILLSLTDNKVIEQREMEAILRDAAAAHRESARLVSLPRGHVAAAVLIEGILTGGNSVRRGASCDGRDDDEGTSAPDGRAQPADGEARSPGRPGPADGEAQEP